MLIIKHILRSIRSSGVRSLLIVCSIMVSAMVMFLNFTTNSDVVQQYKQLQRAIYQDYDILVSSKSLYFTADDLTYPKDDINGRIDFSYFVIENSKDKDSYFKLMGVDVKSFRNDKLITLNGELDKDSVIISESTAQRYDIEIDDVLTWDGMDGEHELTVTAIAEDKGILQADSTFPIIIMENEQFRDLTGLEKDQISAVLLDVKDDVDTSELTKQINSDNEDLISTDLNNNSQAQSNLAMIQMILLVILLIVILLNIYIVTSNSKVLLEKRLYTLGIFRSVGATQGKIIGILLLENLIYSVIGSALGIVLGMIMRKPIVATFTGNTNVDTSFGVEMISYIVFTIAFAIALQLLSTLGQIIKQSKKSIRSILFEKAATALQVSVGKIIFGVILAILSIVLHLINDTYNLIYSALACVCVVLATIMLLPMLLMLISKLFSECVGKLAGYSTGLGIRNLGYSKPTCSNVILITVTLMIVLSIFMLSNSLSSLILGATDQFDCDIRVTGLTETMDKYEFLEDNDSIKQLKPSYYFSDLIELNDIEMSFVVAGLDEEYQGIYEVSGKSIDELGENEALIDEYYASRLKISQGDKITVSCENYSQEDLTLKIVGFVDSSNFSVTRNALVLSTEEYLDKITDVPSVLNVTVKDNKVDEAEEDIRHDLAQYDVVIQTVGDYLAMQLTSTNGIISMVWLILLLSVLLALVGIINNTVLGFMQRKREYAVLISTSMSRLQVLSMIVSEIGFTVFLGCLFAFGITVWLTIVLSDLLYSIGICMSVNIDPGRMLMVLALTFVILMATVIVPIVNLKKMVLVNELKIDS